jgi:Rab-GTPase-TBC domain
MLQALLFYRLDIDYIQGMVNLGRELLLFLEEYDALCCFINLTHSYHFLSFLRGDMREVLLFEKKKF